MVKSLDENSLKNVNEKKYVVNTSIDEVFDIKTIKDTIEIKFVSSLVLEKVIKNVIKSENLTEKLFKNEELGLSYHCDKCNFKAKNENDIKFHIKHVHEGVFYSRNNC